MKRALLIMAAMTTLAAPAFADEALAKSKNCMACHAVDKKLVGPAYKDVAKKYAGDAKAVDALAAKIIKGGSGVWGAIPMPANPSALHNAVNDLYCDHHGWLKGWLRKRPSNTVSRKTAAAKMPTPACQRSSITPMMPATKATKTPKKPEVV